MVRILRFHCFTVPNRGFLEGQGIIGQRWALQKLLNICVNRNKQGVFPQNVTAPEVLGISAGCKTKPRQPPF
jgi:hypothetical protein